MDGGIDQRGVEITGRAAWQRDIDEPIGAFGVVGLVVDNFRTLAEAPRDMGFVLPDGFAGDSLAKEMECAVRTLQPAMAPSEEIRIVDEIALPLHLITKISARHFGLAAKLGSSAHRRYAVRTDIREKRASPSVTNNPS